MENLYTNRSSKRDFVQNGFFEHLKEGMDVFIASAFFTEMGVINSFISKKCHVRIVVRLGFPTSPVALEQLLKHKNIEARFFTDSSFHPKMYIFGDKFALVGSANLTSAAILTNQEVVLGVMPDDERFIELIQLFDEYWEEALVLTSEEVANYKKIYEKYKEAANLIFKMDDEIANSKSHKSFPNIDRGVKRQSKQFIFLDVYRKSYQESVTAFNKILSLYETKTRKVEESLIPIRLEIDSFFSFVRDKYAVHETWKEPKEGWTEEQENKLSQLIDEWLVTDWQHFDEKVVLESYPLIQRIFKSDETIMQATGEEIVEALCALHSFHDCLRFHSGGLRTLKETFLKENELSKIKKSLTHLLYGDGDIVKRMSDCLFDETYKLQLFGQSNIQELVGWINKENLPVVNGRTTKILRYFGFSVRQL